MDGKRRLQNTFLTFAAYVITLTGCNGAYESDMMTDVEISIKSTVMPARSMMPDEERISDINLMIFDDYGQLERHIYMENGRTSHTVSLLKGNRYTIFACANFGYAVSASSIEEASSIKYHLAYPDEYREGMPMSATLRDIIIDEERKIDIELERLMAQISIRVDRSRLAEDVQMEVIGIRIGNCPKQVTVFGHSKVNDNDECFRLGFNHEDSGCIPLNSSGPDGISNELSLYMLENMQGRFKESDLTHDEEKVFDALDTRRDVCSYIEIDLEYRGKELSSSENPLIYRFYLGEDLNSLDVERNCHYHITVCPENDGLHGNGWRVDKSGLIFTGTTKFMQYPGDYITGDIGDRIHIGCRFTPSYAPFDVGLEYLEADKAEGIYDYEIDEDGHGVTLTLKKPGTGLIYMEAGEPVNDSALFLIEVNLPAGHDGTE